MRLIDADKLHYKRVYIYDVRDGEYRGTKSAVVVFADEIDKNKKARVEVVRCKDCKWFAEGKWCRNPNNDMVQGGTTDEWYCADGERREEGTR